MILAIACRNLFHDRVRLIVTLTGIVFAVVLVTLQSSLLIGFMYTISGEVDNSRADVWVASRGVKTFEIVMSMPESRYYQVLAVPGVGDAARMMVDFVFWKRPDGSQESVQVVAYDHHKGIGGPWNIVVGDVNVLDADNAIIMDMLHLDKLGISHLGQELEIAGHKARVMGLTLGIRTFTTSPHVFTSFRNAERFSRFPPSTITYVLVKAAPGVDHKDLARRIAERIPDVETFTTEEFSHKTREYWLVNTGAGGALVLAAVLGVLVGVVVVAQTLYATTLDHLGEFATLKAMGAPDSYIMRILAAQAAVSAVMGYCIGMALCLIIIQSQQFAEVAIILPGAMVVAIFFLTLIMCLAASIISIRKVIKIDPAIVFRGR